MSEFSLKIVGYLEDDQNCPHSLGSIEMGWEDKTDFSAKLGSDWLGLAYVTV